ncbi:MAG: glycosyltransferase family 4 protein [Candidatus Kuenenia sp.]|nr:glycosyltransferase family 4 protein [Candidatus Kuenenia hertensis]
MTKLNNNKKSPKTVLVLTPFFRPMVGGAETYANELCEYLRSHDYYVYVLTYQPVNNTGLKGEKLEKLENMQIRRYQWIGYDLFHKLQDFPVLRILYITSYLFLRSFLWMLKNHKKIDLIDAQGFNAALIARILKIFFKKRAICSVMSLYSFIQGSTLARWVKWTLSGLDMVIVEKGKSKKELMDIGISEDKFMVFNQWVDQERFKPIDKETAKKELGWQNKFIVLYVGRAIPEKGARILLDAAQNVNKNINFAFITDIGAVTEDIIKASREKSNIIFIGEIENKELHKYYQASDIFCLPSQYEEGVARVVAEAVSCGIPLIASNKGSIPYVLDENVSIIIEPTVENFSKKIEYLYNNPEILNKMAEKCRPYAFENFSKKNVTIIVDGYKKLVE